MRRHALKQVIAEMYTLWSYFMVYFYLCDGKSVTYSDRGILWY